MFMQANRQRQAGLLVALLAAALATGAAPRAAATQVVQQQRVRIADLDLGTAAGARVFRQRINAAISRVCQAPAGVAARANLGRMHACRRQAWEGVWAQLADQGHPSARLVTRN